MCGIAGKYFFKSSQSVSSELIEKMVRTLNHRGPDDQGVFVSQNIGLGHARLSIIDLSPAGHQPMSTSFCLDSGKREKCWIVFNGEIYNFLELRKELVNKGHRFKSNTDTEVILHLYEEEGVDCLKRLHGMFAFAIWDETKERLFLARDRVGKKPLVYVLHHESIIFASELKAILQDFTVSKEINPEAVHHYLTYQYIPTPMTIFKGISKLPPGHYLLHEKGKTEIHPYWSLHFKDKYQGSLKEATRIFLSLFEDAVRSRLMSDVPLGAFLSGGIDSSAVVAAMARLSSSPVKTFSIGFDEKEFDELTYARMVAKKYRTDHHEWVVKPDIVSILPKLAWHYNEPYADASAIPVFYLSEMARHHVKVVLNGDGGDESFAGYQRYLAEKISRMYGRVPYWVQKGLIKPLVNRISFGNSPKSNIRRLKRLVSSFDPDPQTEHVSYIGFFDNASKSLLYSDDFSEQIQGVDSVDFVREWYQKADGPDFLDQTLYVDCMTYLPDDLLVKMDIATMAYGLEARSPFLDHQMMKFAASLPSPFKLKGFQLKYFLKKAFQDELPREILHRRKMGFGAPMELWLRNELKELAKDVLLGEQSVKRGYFKPRALKKLYDEHQSGEIDHSSRIWALVMLEQWHRVFVDQNSLR
ncbi:MAG: asparagine synthase (glutamine-hydrolyzing) [Nitrospiria bacterium]